MKTKFAPPWWRPGVDSEFHSRRSGLPLGYFDRRKRWREVALIVAVCAVIVIASITK